MKWRAFLALGDNKADFARILSDELISQALILQSKYIWWFFIRSGFCSDPGLDVAFLRSNQEEVDTKFVRYAVSLSGHVDNVIVSTRGTDLLHVTSPGTSIALSSHQQCGYGQELQRIQHGFQQAECSGYIQSANKIGFWCDWDVGDGSVMMIDGGGNACARADHGIGITETNEASFVEEGGIQTEYDFGYNAKTESTQSQSYSLNLWIR
ncbi:hypothetical protein ACROYT_G031616 [Oculina patagonica]